MIRSFTGFRPSPRYDDVSWNRVRIGESATIDGAYTVIDTILFTSIGGPDSDPENPMPRNFTTSNATLTVAWYEITFLDASDNEDVADPVRFPGGGYPSAAELVTDSEVEALTTLPYADQQVLYLSSRYGIEEYCGQVFDYQPGVTRLEDGSGRRKINLTKRLEALDTLVVEYASLDAGDVHMNEEHSALYVNANAGIGNYYERAMYEVQGRPSLTFTAGPQTVSITGDWGWLDFPEPVREAMRIDMEDQALADTNALGDTLRAFRALGLRNVAQGNLQAAMSSTNALSERAVRLLNPFVWSGPVGVVV